MKIVVQQIQDLLLKLKTIEARLTGLEVHEEDKEHLNEAELLLHKYNAEALKLEQIIIQKKIQLSQK